MAENLINVLLVEDNPGDASLLRRMLSTIPNQVRTKHVGTLADCLQLLRGGTIDVVLLDLGLPDSTGLDTLTRVRAHAPKVPIIVITGFSTKDLAVAALEQGAQDFITKERVDAHLLTQAIYRGVGRRNGQSQARASAAPSHER